MPIIPSGALRQLKSHMEITHCSIGHEVFQCEQCGAERIYGINTIDSDAPEVKRALIFCHKCDKNTWHEYEFTAGRRKKLTPVPVPKKLSDGSWGYE